MDHKNSGLAAILCFFYGGLGQIYNGQIAKGLLIMVLQVINIFLIFVYGIGFITGGAVWVWAIYDAYQTALELNRNYALGESKIGSGGSGL